MNHQLFSQILLNTQADRKREYDRLYSMFFLQKYQDGAGQDFSLRDFCALNFLNVPFRGTCVTLDDFDDYYEYNFEKMPSNFDENYLVRFCEYSYNLVIYSQGYWFRTPMMYITQPMQFYLQQVILVIEKIGYMANVNDGITDFVPKDQAAIAASETVEKELSYRLIEYRHNSLQGNLGKKREIIIALADQIEPHRKTLKEWNTAFEDNLFFLLNNINLRQNNIDPEGGYYKSYVAQMKKEEIEQWYDDTYQMCLLALLMIDNNERKKRANQLKKDLNQR